MKDNSQIEQQALKISIVSTVFFVALGLGFAFYTKSDTILFDGVYSFCSFEPETEHEIVIQLSYESP